MKQKLSGRKTVGLIMGIALAVAAGVWGSDDFLHAPDPLTYKEASGEVVSVWVDVSKSQRNTCAEYEYEVAGRKYKSSQHAFHESTFPFDTMLHQPVIVYYQPGNPALSVLDRRRPTQKMFTALMLMGLFGFGTIVAVFAPDPPWMRRNSTEKASNTPPSGGA